MPAPTNPGILERLKCFGEPVDETSLRRRAKMLDPGGGEYDRKSISWQDLVNMEGAVTDPLRQLPVHCH